MDVNAGSNAVNLRNYSPVTSSSPTKGVDRDGDNDGSGSSGANGGNSISVNVQISNAGKARHAHHHGGHHGPPPGPNGTQGPDGPPPGGPNGRPFSASQFASKLDTSGLSSDQQQTLKDILSKYDGKTLDKSALNQLASDLKNSGLDLQKLFDKFQPKGNQQVSNNYSNSSQTSVSISVTA